VLHRLGLLENVTVLSTVSGGSITGAGYALAAARGRSFEEFFEELHDVLARNDLPGRALAALRSGAPATPSGCRKLIVAAAEAYDAAWLDGASFGELLEARTHLQEVILNATEFRHGLSFRFRASASSRVRIGNQRTSLPRDVAARVRLADIVAASSCFPGGFEPLVLPDDLRWLDTPAGSAPDGLAGLEPVALMDGGITDNQGVDSMRLADQTRGVELGLIIISDTDRATERLHRPLAAPPGPGARLWWVAVGAALVTTGLVASGLALAADALRAATSDGLQLPTDLLLRWFPAAVCLGLAGLALWSAGRGILSLRRHLPASLLGVVLAVGGGLGLGELRHLVRVRARSLAAMVSHVFTRRIRRQVFEAAYEDERYRDRVVANLLYRLPRDRDESPRPSAALLEVAERAGRMPTTLWFRDADELPTLIACGQATLCHALLAHIKRIDEPDEKVEAVAAATRDLWERLNDDPFALVRERVATDPAP
jgi:predicted acylesterase/phospholipase RssA